MGQELAPFDAWLAAELERAGLSPVRLARLSGVHRSTISRLLHGQRRPRVETATRIAVAIASLRPHDGDERRTDVVARVRHELAADPTPRPQDVNRVMTRHVRQRTANRTSLRA